MVWWILTTMACLVCFLAGDNLGWWRGVTDYFGALEAPNLRLKLLNCKSPSEVAAVIREGLR